MPSNQRIPGEAGIQRTGDPPEACRQEAVEEKIIRIDKSRLVRECAMLDPSFEKHLAEEGISQDFEKWPEY